MHQTMKKAWAVLLTLCLLLGALPLTANAALVDADQYVTQQLSLGEDLVLHLRASLPENAASMAKDAVGTLTYAGKTKTYTMDDMTPDENGMYDMAVEMAVAEMTEDIHAVVNAKVLGFDSEIINEHYSIRNYLVTIIEGDYSQTTKDLCLELLNMGAWAQLYFNHNISNLANAGYDTAASNAVPEESPAVEVVGKVDGIQFYGTSVRFLSQTAVRFYFTADSAVNGYTFTIDGATYNPVAKDGMYYIETPGINPQNMSDVITVNVTDGSETLSVEYAPIWYFIRTYNKTENEYSKGLMEAAYSYYKTAESYKTQICMDVEISTLSGNYESIGLGFYPLDFEGDINNYVDRIEIPAGETYTVKLDQGKYLVDGEFKGIGVTVLGGPTWDAKLEDGETPDRHNIQISGLRLEGPEDRPIDLTFATIASGNENTGYTNANAGGTASLADGVITFANGFFTDGYKITFNEVETYLVFDMEISTLSGNFEAIGIGFYPHDFEGDINNHLDRFEVPTDTTYTVKLDMSKYLVDGELPGIGFAVMGGPTWDAKLEDGETPDRHNITITNFRLEGELDQSIDLSSASLACGQDGTGYTNANAGGTATVADGIITIANGFFTDGYKLTFVGETTPEETEPEATEPETTEPEATEPPVEEPDTYLCMDLDISTLGNSTDPIEVRLYNYSYAASVADGYTDQITVTPGTTANIKVDADKYLVEGQLPGFGIAIFGGPEWNTYLEDGTTPDRHTFVISNVRLEGTTTATYDLYESTVTTGTNGTNYTWANGAGQKQLIDGNIVISGGYRYDGHKITLVEESGTYLCMDMKITTLGGETGPIDFGFYPYNFEGDINNHPFRMGITAGKDVTVRLKVDDYLVNGELPGIGFAIFGGPAWDAKLPDGHTPDRHTITISNVRLEGEQTAVYDLSKSAWASGTNGTGFTNANGSGVATMGSSIVISGGFCYDGHKISLVEDTNTYLCMDLDISTLGNSKDPIEVRLYNYSYAASVADGYTDLITVTPGTAANIKVDADNYLVDGQLPGFGIAIFGGPEWNTQLDDGTYDRHTFVISNVRLEGTTTATYDLYESTVTTGTNGTNYTWANGSGQKSLVDGNIVISGGYRYDGHKITLVEESGTYLCMDMKITTLGGETGPIDFGFYPYNFEGDINGQTLKMGITAGKDVTVRLKVDDYLVDGELPGIGFAIFNGPAWDAKLPDGHTPDRHTITISNARLEGEQTVAYDLSKSTWASGANGTGIANTNGSGVAAIGETIVITNGFRYDGHKISLVEDTNTYLCLDLELTTLSGSTDPVNIRLYNYNYEGSVGDGCTDLVTVTAGTTTKIKVKVDNYLVNGELPGFGFAVFGGPEWNTPLEGGGHDRHNIVISNVRLEGVQEQSFNLNAVASGTNGTGFSWANSGGVASIVDGELVVTDGYMYDAYELTF